MRHMLSQSLVRISLKVFIAFLIFTVIFLELAKHFSYISYLVHTLSMLSLNRPANSNSQASDLFMTIEFYGIGTEYALLMLKCWQE